MSFQFIEGIGMVAIDSNKSHPEKMATIKYYQEIAPKYEDLGGFFGGFGDTKSMIFRWGQRLGDSGDEEKTRWFGHQVEEWGNQIGYYDSIALEKYHQDMEKLRPLDELEQADREANNAVMRAFQADMYDAYDNKEGDISDVQQRWGYTAEDIGTLSSLWEFAKMAVNEPSYTLGSVAGMVLKDPELLLLSALRVPGSTSATMSKFTAAANRVLATKNAATIEGVLAVQPTYMKSFVNMVGAQRTQAVVGRGLEGAMYGGTYEALHDLTFNGHIKAENVERGLAFGALLGTGFGAISKSTGKSWLRDKAESSQALKNVSLLEKTFGKLKWVEHKAQDGTKSKVLSWQSPKKVKAELERIKKERAEGRKPEVKTKPKPTTKPEPEKVDPNKADKNPEFRKPEDTPVELILPSGLDHISRATKWRERVVEQFSELYGKGGKKIKKGEKPLTPEEIEALADTTIADRMEFFKLKKNKDGSQKYTKDEITGLAAKEIAKEGEQSYSKLRTKKEKIRRTTDKEWGKDREKAWGEENIKNSEVFRDTSTFDYLYKQRFGKIPKPTLKQYIKAGAIGAGAGWFIADEDKTLGGLLGLVGGLLLRGNVKGINLSQAKIRARVYNVVDASVSIQKRLEIQAGKTLNVLDRILKGKDTTLSELDFLAYIEDYSKPPSQTLFGKEGRIKNLNKEQIKAIDAYRDLMIRFEKAAKEVGVLEDGQFIADYVTHIFKNRNISPEVLRDFKSALGRKGSNLDDISTYSQVRKLAGNIKELSEKYPELETDVFKILDAYSRSMSKAIAGKNIVKTLENTAVMDGETALSVIMDKSEMMAKYAQEKLGYKVSNHPALNNKLVHPLVKNSLDDFYAPEIGTEGMLNKILIVNNAMKRLAISFSLFHAQALVLSGVYSGVAQAYLTKAGRARMVKVKEMMDGQWDYHSNAKGEKVVIDNMTGRETKGDFVHGDVLREIASEGVEVGLKASEYVDAGYNTVKALLEKYAPPLAKGQALIDRLTWDITHDRLKVFTYLTMKERLMSHQARGIARFGDWKPLSEAEARASAAEFTNDAYGGQRHSKLALEWQKKAIANADNPKGALYNLFALWTTPSKAKLSNLVLFSPDWTISNLRIGFRGLGMTKDIVGKIARGKKLTPKEMGEWNLYMGYMARAFVSTSLLAWGLHSAFADDDSELDLQDFWHSGRLDLGNGEEMVVSKQIAEPMHWLVNPMQTGLNKSASFPKATLELFLGKEYVSLKHGKDDRTFLTGGGVIGPPLDRGSPKDMMGWMFSKVTPISLSPLTRAYRKDEDKKHAFAKTMFGSVGLPIYGTRK